MNLKKLVISDIDRLHKQLMSQISPEDLPRAAKILSCCTYLQTLKADIISPGGTLN